MQKVQSDMSELQSLSRKPGLAQGWTVILAGYLPILAIVSLFPAVPSIIAHFRLDPSAMTKVPAMVSAPGWTIAFVALFAGYFVDRFGRRRLLIAAAAIYGAVGTSPLILTDLEVEPRDLRRDEVTRKVAAVAVDAALQLQPVHRQPKLFAAQRSETMRGWTRDAALHPGGSFKAEGPDRRGSPTRHERRWRLFKTSQ